ncbi:MAG: hypothetical protein AB1411_06300 [Nitrospirota bacterium]
MKLQISRLGDDALGLVFRELTPDDRASLQAKLDSAFRQYRAYQAYFDRHPVRLWLRQRGWITDLYPPALAYALAHEHEFSVDPIDLTREP